MVLGIPRECLMLKGELCIPALGRVWTLKLVLYL